MKYDTKTFRFIYEDEDDSITTLVDSKEIKSALDKKWPELYDTIIKRYGISDLSIVKIINEKGYDTVAISYKDKGNKTKIVQPRFFSQSVERILTDKSAIVPVMIHSISRIASNESSGDRAYPFMFEVTFGPYEGSIGFLDIDTMTFKPIVRLPAYVDENGDVVAFTQVNLNSRFKFLPDYTNKGKVVRKGKEYKLPGNLNDKNIKIAK